ncbi:hypothetical protein BKA65DRAFT_249108 [Rhexocercosporidium sp. MPI-PUGE-AT-0058]|nr:hypothetical protein BKA65DRAFT_249108 [Rhexocercosporidium sp. MPI-PUGE-AT-0058]
MLRMESKTKACTFSFSLSAAPTSMPPTSGLSRPLARMGHTLSLPTGIIPRILVLAGTGATTTQLRVLPLTLTLSPRRRPARGRTGFLLSSTPQPQPSATILEDWRPFSNIPSPNPNLRPQDPSGKLCLNRPLFAHSHYRSSWPWDRSFYITTKPSARAAFFSDSPATSNPLLSSKTNQDEPFSPFHLQPRNLEKIFWN